MYNKHIYNESLVKSTPHPPSCRLALKQYCVIFRYSRSFIYLEKELSKLSSKLTKEELNALMKKVPRVHTDFFWGREGNFSTQNLKKGVVEGRYDIFIAIYVFRFFLSFFGLDFIDTDILNCQHPSFLADSV